MKFNYITTPDKARVEVDGTRRYRWGEKLPSVTTILSAVPDPGKAIALARWRERVGEEEAEKIKNDAAKTRLKAEEGVNKSVNNL